MLYIQVDEDQLYGDTEGARTLAKRLKEETKCLKKGSSQKKVLEVMQRIVRLEQELREKQARGESIEAAPVRVGEKDDTKKEVPLKKDATKAKPKGKEGVAKAFLAREVTLRKQDLTSRKCEINLPFPLKKILTDDWEIITQCGMLHSLPTSVTVMDALNSYYEGKMKVLNASDASGGKEEEKKDDGIEAEDDSSEPTESQNNEQEWKEMVDGIALFFDQALPKRLLFTQEIPQCLLLEQNHEKRYCELYPCEYLIRMCIKLPDSLQDAEHISDEEKSRIHFKVGDLLRFLNRHQDVYFLQRYRKATLEESAKSERLKKRLGLGPEEEEKGCEDEKPSSGEEIDEENEKEEGNRKRSARSNNGGKQKKRKA